MQGVAVGKPLPVQVELPFDGEAVAGLANRLEGQLPRGRQDYHPGVQGFFRTAHHRCERLDIAGIRLPFLRLLLHHYPEPYAFGDFGPAAALHEFAEHRVGVELAFEQTPPRHHRVRIIEASAGMLLGILRQRFYVAGKRLGEPAAGHRRDAEFLGQTDSGVVREQSLQGRQPSRLGEDQAVEAGLIRRHEIFANCFPELLELLACQIAGVQSHGRIE